MIEFNSAVEGMFMALGKSPPPTVEDIEEAVEIFERMKAKFGG